MYFTDRFQSLMSYPSRHWKDRLWFQQHSPLRLMQPMFPPRNSGRHSGQQPGQTHSQGHTVSLSPGPESASEPRTSPVASLHVSAWRRIYHTPLSATLPFTYPIHYNLLSCLPGVKNKINQVRFALYAFHVETCFSLTLFEHVWVTICMWHIRQI